jgi:hypothetical protein
MCGGAADFDSDGDIDLAFGMIYGGQTVLLNNGQAVFTLDSLYWFSDYMFAPTSLYAADLDGDGDLDLAVSNQLSEDVSILLNNGHVVFATQYVFALGFDPYEIAAADLDRDGDLDLAVVPQSQEEVGVTVLLNRSYICGDSDGSKEVDIDDVVYLINYIFSGGPEPDPYESGDADCSGEVDIDDVVWLINYIFSGGNAPCDTDGDEESDC